MTPDLPPGRRVPLAGRKGGPARGAPHDVSRAEGHIPCAICTHTIHLDDYRSARCWTDPTGITVAAHRSCLIRVGESDLNLPPDPGEHTTTASDPGVRHEHAAGFRVVESP